MHGVRGEFRLILAEWVNTIYVIGVKGTFSLLVKEGGGRRQSDINTRETTQSSALFKIAESNVKNKANCA
jgi:hypothetical protein